MSDFTKCQQAKVIRFGDDFAERSETNLLFGLNPRAGMMKGAASLKPVGRIALIWWPSNPGDNNEWVDVKEQFGPLSDSRGWQEVLQISEMNRDPEENKRHLEETLANPWSQTRYVFWHESYQNARWYKFYGVYKFMREKSQATGKCWFERVAKQIEL